MLFLVDWLYIWISDRCLLSSCVKQKYGFISHEFRADRIDKIIGKQLKRDRTSSTGLATPEAFSITMSLYPLWFTRWWKFHCSWCGRARNNYGVVSNNPVSMQQREVNSPSVRPGTWMMLLILIEDFTWVIDWVEICRPLAMLLSMARAGTNVRNALGKCVVLVRDLDDRSFGVVMRLISKMIETRITGLSDSSSVSQRCECNIQRRWYRFQLSD